LTGTLYIVATPIGNLGDLSLRLKTCFEEVDFILAEDTRVTLKLLNHLEIKKKLYSYQEHSSEQKGDRIVEQLIEGKSYALVSDAGTPAVSDPGARLVQKALENDIAVVPIPGPSAVTTLVSIMGIRETSFHFWSFFPIKKKKQRILCEHIANIPGIHIFFESPMRIIKTLNAYFVDQEDYYMVVGREMTKKFETFYRGTPMEVREQIESDETKGEFCVGVVKQGSDKKAERAE
jgi:16S rRNA (cytidine1402-2'-O)-methyltransferase